MKFKIISDLAIFIDNIVPEKHLSKLQEFLLSGAIFTDASKVLAILMIFILVSEFALALLITMFGLPVSVLILPFFCNADVFHICYCPAGEKSTGN
jgi:flagellar protein FlaJ